MRSAPLSIRPAARFDLEILTDLAMRSKASHGYDAAFMEQCREELAIGERTLSERDIWVAEAQGRILGFFGLAFPQDGVCEVNPIFVEPDLQQGGVGRALWRKLEERARFAGARAIGLDSDPNAVGFYEKMGCRIVGLSPSNSIAGRMLPRMEKPLDPPPDLNLCDAQRVQSRNRIIVTARQMLAGECSYIEGSRIISGLLVAAGIDRQAHPFAFFAVIESETDHIPVGRFRAQWHPDALAKFAPEWNEREARAKHDGEAACRQLIAMLARQTGGPAD